MSERGTLELIAHQLVGAVRPLEEAFSNADTFRVLMLQLGWDAQGLPASYSLVADKTVQATTALDNLQDGASISEVIAVIEKAGAVYNAMKALNEAPAGIDASVFLPELAHRLFEYLLGRQLFAEAPGVYALLEALGIISLEDHPATSERPGFARFRFDWDQIPATLSDSSLIPERVYGWGTPHLNFPKIAELVTEVILGLGLSASLDRISQEQAAALQEQATGPPEATAAIGMTIALFDVPLPTGDAGLVGLLFTELPAEGTALPGMVLLPLVPDHIAEHVELGLGWTFSLRAGTDLTSKFGVVLRPEGVSVRYPGAPGQTLPSAGFGLALRYDTDTPLVLLGHQEQTRLELGSAELTGAIDVKAGELELTAGANVTGLALVIEPSGTDSFLTSILGNKPLRIDMGVTLSWSSRAGLSFIVEGGFGITVFPNVKLGILRFDRVDLGVQVASGPPPALRIEAATSFSGSLGPIDFSVDQLGVQLPVLFKDGNAGPFDISLGLKGPKGVGLAVDASVVVGGGFLEFNSEKGEYAGIIQLKIAEKIAVTGIALLSTKLPGGISGFSLVVIIFVEGFTPIQLGFGFTLTAIGGLLAINRTFDEEVLRSGLKNHTLDSVMFPKDPIRNAPQILSNLNKVFPPAKDHYLFGPMVQLAWGTPPLITANVGLIFEFGTRTRLLILGQVSAALPKPENDLIRLQMDSVGLIDFDQGTASLDATLHDSRLLHKYTLTGDMAMRMQWKSSPNFALAVGGFHPAFKPPANFPKLDRIAINLCSGDNPRLRCEAYFALTSNTVQFGARAELYAAAHGFSIQGETRFDVLIQFDPFQFIAEFSAQIQLKHGSTNLFKVRVEGALSGPRPLHLKAKATFEIFWWDISIRVDKTLVEGEAPPLPEPIDVMPRLKEALRNRGNWKAQLPDRLEEVVTLRANVGNATDVLLHPLGSLLVQQNTVPLNLEISKFGPSVPAGARKFRIITPNQASLEPVKDFFAPAQFIEMSDNEKLSRPSFESMEAGVVITSHAFLFTTKAADLLEVEAIEFETKIMDPVTNTPVSSDPVDQSGKPVFYKLDFGLMFTQARFGAASRSKTRRTGEAKYRTTIGKYKIVKEGWNFVGVEDLAVSTVPGIGSGQTASYSEAREALRTMKDQDPVKASSLRIMRRSDLVGS